MKLKFTLKILLLTLLSIIWAFVVKGQKNYFEPLAASRLKMDVSMTKNIKKLSFYTLKEKDLKNYLAKAPLEFKSNGVAPLPLEIPLPNGLTETFEIFESPILSPEIAAKHPEIKTYTGKGKAHKNYTIRLSFTSQGANAIIVGLNNDAAYYDKVSKDKSDNVYRVYMAGDAERPAPTKAFGQIIKCGTEELPVKANKTPSLTKGARVGSSQNNSGTVLRTFRLAMAADAEFTQQPAFGGDVNLAYAAVVGYVNRANAVFRSELSVAFTLVSDVSVVYSDTATDPYTDSNMGLTMAENQANLDAVIGSANYDIGHVLGSNTGGGVVSGRVCDDDSKARGTTGPGFGPDPYGDQVLFHELGHQFGMSHSYNSNLGGCTTRNPATAVEPGSGATILSYDYICSDSLNTDDYEQPAQFIFNFHSISYQQAEEFIATVSCYSSTPLNNSAPIVSMPINRTIPKSTPFSLTGSATDANPSDVLTYSWEGTNIATMVPNETTLDDPAQPPFFRSYEPVSTGTRVFPRLSAILNGTNQGKGDKLPSIGIVTTHRLTARDGVGGVTYGEMTVTIDGNSGPFLETTNLAGSYPGNSSKIITWSVNGTNTGAVNSPNVNILLSTDGGLTFPTTLLSNTPNDGNQSVTLPAVLTSTARIKVESSNNIFFDISNSNFSITAPEVIVCKPSCPVLTVVVLKK